MRSEKGITVSTHMYADCLLESTPVIHNTYVVNQNVKHFDDISCRELFGRIRVFVFQNKIGPFLRQGICIDVDHSLLRNTIGQIIFICLLVLSGKQ